MRPAATAWERAAEVREAAQGWRRVGTIDEATLRLIETRYPDPCVTPSVLWRVLTAGMVSAVLLCVLGALWIATGLEQVTGGPSVLLLVLAVASFVATEHLERSPRLARRGAAGATAFWGIVFLLVGLGLLLEEILKVRLDMALDMVALASVLAWGLASRRWGNPFFAGLSAASLSVFLARVPPGRALWVVGGVVLVGLASRRLDEPRRAPSARRSAAVLVVVGLAAVYVGANVYSLDARLLEQLRHVVPPRTAPGPGVFVLAAVTTAALPVVVLLWAVRSRRTFLLDTGIVLLALSLVTLRHYVHVAPRWVVLTVSGAAIGALALAVERMLRRGPDGERAGYTADALFSDERRQRVLEIVPVAATFTPVAVAPAAAPEGVAGRGGAFGGAGASEKF
jgi:hypothetical protein